MTLPTETATVSLTLPTGTQTASLTFTQTLSPTISESLTGTLTLSTLTLSPTLTETVTRTQTVTKTATPTWTDSVSLPTETRSLTATRSWTKSATDTPTATFSLSLTLPTASVSPSATFSLTGTFTLTLSITLPTPSATWTSSMTIPTGTETFSITHSISLTVETANNFTGTLLPGEGIFYEGQDVRVAVTDMLDSDTERSYFNYSDQVSYEIRVYEYTNVFGTVCERYNVNETDPSYQLVKMMDSQVGFGMSVHDHLSNRTYIPTAFTTFTAPSHMVEFLICFRRTKTREDKHAMTYFPIDGVWQLFHTATGAHLFRSKRGRSYYSFPETPTPNQFTVMKLYSYDYNFTTAQNCTSDTSLMQHPASPESNATYSDWACLKGDSIKIVPKGVTCTFEPKLDRMGHPYLGTYFVNSEGEWHHEAGTGLFEGAVEGGVGILSGRTANPMVGEKASDATLGAYRSVGVYIKLPASLGHYDICYSSMEHRAEMKRAALPEGTISRHPHDIPLWRKLFPCDDRSGACIEDSPSSDEPHFEVMPEDVSWHLVDFTPMSWGSIRVQAPSRILSRHPVSMMQSDNLETSGGDWIRLIQDFRFLTTLPALDFAPIPGVQVGTFPPTGCWPSTSEFLTIRDETGDYSPRSTYDLNGNPFYRNDDDDAVNTVDTFFSTRLPQALETFYVCYRRGGWASWRMLVVTPSYELPKMWKQPSVSYPYAVMSPTPIVTGWYEDTSSTGAQVRNMTMQWVMNDTRSGTWGPIHIEDRYNGYRLSAGANDVAKFEEEWVRLSENMGVTLADVKGTAIRIVPVGFPCDQNSNRTERGLWFEYSDGGEEECHWGQLTPQNIYCQGSASDSGNLQRVTFYIQLPSPGDYEVCVRTGAFNWVVATAASSQYFYLAEDYRTYLTVTPAVAFGVSGFIRTETDASVVISGREAFAVGHGGDFARLVYNREPCDLTPQSWFQRRHEYDTVLGSHCGDLDSSKPRPCNDPRGEFIREVDRKGLAHPDRFEDDVHSGIVAYFHAAPHNITYHPVKIDARVCIKSALTPNWFWADIPTFPELRSEVSPPGGSTLTAGALERFVLSVFGVEEPHNPVNPLRGSGSRGPMEVFPFHAKLVPHWGDSANSHCGNVAAGVAEPPYFLSQTFEAKPLGGEMFEFFIDTPLREGEYWLCVSLNISTVWKRSLYTVLDNGMRWYVKENENPVNQGSSSVYIQRCRGRNCLPTDTFDTDAGADRAKIVQWDLPCETSHHVGLEGGGLFGHTNLGPSDGPQRFARFDMTFPQVPSDTPSWYKVCVYTALDLKGGSKVWVSIQEDSGVPGQQVVGGLQTSSAIFGAFGVAARLGPLTWGALPGAKRGPTGLAGALTAYISDTESADPRVTIGLWLTPTVPSQHVSRQLVADVQFKLVPWPTCEELEVSSCQRSGWCIWNGSACKDKPGIVYDCRSSGVPSSVIPSPSCVESVGACPRASAEERLPPGAPKGSVALVFHLPEPGRYLACGKLSNGPWRFVQSNGSQTLQVVDPRIQMDPGKVSFENPGSNLTVFDIHGVNGVSLASWCAVDPPNDFPDCTTHFQPAMRRDWVAVVNDTQVCMPSLYPGDTGWVPLRRTGKALSAVAPGSVEFRLPPQDPTPSGQYRVCVLKTSFAKQAILNTPISGAIAQPGLSYTMWNRAPPSLGTGGSTFLLTAGMPDELAVSLEGTWDTSKQFHVWNPSLGYLYEGLNAVKEQPTKSVEIGAGDLITITLTAMTRGLVAGVGTFPVSVETCVADDWHELTCDTPTPGAVTLVNVPSSSGCSRGGAADYQWPSDGTTQFMVSGRLTYTIRFLSLCKDTAFKSGCGIKFVGNGLQSPAVWFSIRANTPDGILSNGTAVPLHSTVQKTCWHRQTCSLWFEATAAGLREFAPSGNVTITLEGGLAPALQKVTGLYEVTQPWGQGGDFGYDFRPYVVSGQSQQVLLRIAFENGRHIFVEITVRRLVAHRLLLRDLVPIDVELKTHGISPPAPMWSPALTEQGPFTLMNETASTAWESQPGMHLVALTPYELRMELFDLANLPLQQLGDWKADLSFGTTEAERRNRILSVPPTLNEVTATYTTPQMTPPYMPLTPTWVRGTNHTYSVRFRLFNNLGCTRREPCTVFVTLTNGTITVRASMKVSVRVPGNALKILAQNPVSAVHRGLRVSVTPGSFDTTGAWLPDEFNDGDVFALMSGSSDGITDTKGLRLADTVGKTPARYNMEWIDAITPSVFDVWGARWVLRTTRPCADCKVTFHTTSGLGPTSDTTDGGTLAFVLTDETYKVACEAKSVGYSSGSLSSEEFSVTVTPTTRSGEPTMWADWPVTIDPVNDFLQDGESVLTGLLSLHHKGSSGVIRENMVAGVATVAGLYVKIPDNYQGGMYNIRSTVHGDGGVKYQCSTSITLQRSTRSQGYRRIAVHLVDGGESMCAEESLLGCNKYSLLTNQALRLKVRYYNGTSENDLLTDPTDRDLSVRLQEDIVKWGPCEGACDSRDVELRSTHSPVVTEENGVKSTLSQGASVVKFSRQVTGGWSAPQGLGFLTMVQQKANGFTTPVREAVFEVCDRESIEGELSFSASFIPCREVRVWILPAAPVQKRHATIVSTSLSQPDLRYGVPGCGNAITKVTISASVYYIWGNVKYIAYDVPLEFSLEHGSGQTLVQVMEGDRLGVSQPKISVGNGLLPSMPTRELLQQATQVVSWTFYGLYAKPLDTFRVSVTNLLRVENAPNPSETSGRYGWPPRLSDSYPSVAVMDTPQRDDACFQRRRFPRIRDHYKRHEIDPGQGWSYTTNRAAMVGSPFPLQVQVKTVDGERAWSFSSSPIVLRSKIATKGCNDGGNLTVYHLKDTTTGGVIDLQGTADDFIQVPTNHIVTEGGQATLWVTLSSPCQECVIELALCYQSALTLGLDTCHSLGGTEAEERNGPMVSRRIFRTQPFTVLPMETGSVAITSHSIPAGNIVVGEAFSVTLEPVLEFESAWMMHPPADYRQRNQDITVDAEVKVKWVDSALSVTGTQLRYGNGGFLRVGATQVCETSRDALLTASYRSGGTMTRLVSFPTTAQEADMKAAGATSVWHIAPLQFSFVRPCSNCEVWIRAILRKGGDVLSEWQAPLRHTSHDIARYHVASCGTQWIWGGAPPRAVSRRKPFSLTVWRADVNQIPSWSGSVAVSLGKVDTKLGGQVVFTSHLESRTPPTVTSSGGVAMFRLEATRSCHGCVFRVANLFTNIMVVSNATRVIAIPRVKSTAMHTGGDFPQSGVWTFDLYAADDLGDRAYVGGPTYVQRLPPFLQGQVSHVDLSPLSSPHDSDEAKVLFLSGGPLQVNLADRMPVPKIVHGRFMQNGVPIDQNNGSIPACLEDCDRPGTAVVILQGNPNLAFRLTSMMVGGVRLPVSLEGKDEAPLMPWSVPPSAVIFSDVSKRESYSGVALRFTMLAIGGIPGTKTNDYPSNVTYHLSNVPFEVPPAFTFSCNLKGHWVLQGVEYAWGTPVVFHPQDARHTVEVTPHIAHQTKLAVCSATILPVQPHYKAFKAEPENLMVPAQPVEVLISPDEITPPTDWSWLASKGDASSTKELMVLVGLETTIMLYGHGHGRSVQLNPSVAASMQLSFLTIPSGCFVPVGGHKVGQVETGPTLQWSGFVTSIEVCKIQSVLGLPVGTNKNALVITAARRHSVGLEKLSGIDSATSGGDPAVVAGADVTLDLLVKDSLGNLVEGDSETTVNINYLRCMECCRLQNPLSCQLNDSESLPPHLPLTARASQGRITIRIIFHSPTQPRVRSADPDVSAVVLPHVPWLINITTPGLWNDIPFLPAIYVVVVAKEIHVSALLGDGAIPFPTASPPVAVPWVVGFPFRLRLTSIDSAVPPNIPKGADRGASAKIQVQPVAIPCRSADDEAWTLCPAGDSCRLSSPQWLGGTSQLWSTCLSKAVNPSTPGYGTCDLIPIPECKIRDWSIGSQRVTDTLFTLTHGAATLPSIRYYGVSGVVSLTLSSDEVLPAMESYTRVILMDMQRISYLRFSSSFITSCEVPEGESRKPSDRLCYIAGDPFVAPPPVEPVRNPDNSWFKPDRGLVQIQPAAEAPVGGSVIDITLDVVDEHGRVAAGDTLTEMTLNMRCADPDQSRRERFYMGYVNNDLTAVPLIARAPPGGFLGRVVNGQVTFPRVGFHGYCSNTVLYADCVTPNSTDTLMTCKGLHAETEPFEVGSVDMVLLAPVFPPLEDAPSYTYPAVQLALGMNLTCNAFQQRSSAFLELLKKAIVSITPIRITEMKVHAGCAVPKHRFQEGILSVDYADPGVCCPQLSSAPIPDGSSPADNISVTVTQVPTQADTPSPDAAQRHWLGALTSGDCSAVEEPRYRYDPSLLTSRAAVRCCSIDGASCVSEGSAECLPGNESFSNAQTLCADLKLRLCTAQEIVSCCDSPCSPGVQAWVSDASLNADNYTNCSVVWDEPYVTRSTAGYDVLHINATLEGCTAACCALGRRQCTGFSRSLHVSPGDISECWLKAPHPPSERELSTTYLLHLLYDERTPAPPAPTEVLLCSLRNNETACSAGGMCAWVASTGCVDALFCPKDHHVSSGECVACPKGMTRSAGDEVHAGATLCYGCDGVLDSNSTIDSCGICNGDDSSCKGCDGVPNSGATLDPCSGCSAAQDLNASTCDACAITPAAVLGTRVIRGPDWQYGNQDSGRQGEITSYSPCEGGQWAEVTWDGVFDASTSRIIQTSNTYRAGCGGKYDLSSVACVKGKCPSPSCNSASGTSREACESLGCSWAVSGGSCTGELSSAHFCPCAAWTRSDCAALPACSFVRGSCVGRDAACPVDHHVSNGLCTPCSPGLTNPAGESPSGGDTQCYGCDGLRGSGTRLDQCGVCSGDDSSCMGCDGIPNSGLSYDECGVCGGSADCTSCAITPASAAIGKRVVWGPDWTYPATTGTKGGWIREKKEACDGGNWYTVQWEDGPTAWYRVGCFGAYDLASESCATRLRDARDSCAALSDCSGDPGCLLNETAGACAPTARARCRTTQVRSNCTGPCHWHGGACNDNLCFGLPPCSSDQCNAPGACDPTTGLCAPMEPLPNSTVCDDGVAETLGDRCLGGVCVPQLLCRDNLTLLHDMMVGEGHLVHQANTSCDGTMELFAVGCGTRLRSGKHLQDACCATCALPPSSQGVENSTNATNVTGEALSQAQEAEGRAAEVQEAETVAAGEGASRHLLQAPGSPLEPTYFVLELEVRLGDEHNTAERQGEDARSIFSAMGQAFFSDQFQLCTEFASLCVQVRAACQGSSQCPVVNELLPITIPKVTDIPTIVPLPPKPTRPPELQSHELTSSAVRSAPRLVWVSIGPFQVSLDPVLIASFALLIAVIA